MTRPEYIAGNYLFAEDLLTEQYYRQQRLRRHNRFSHNWGVVCGLRVVPGHESSRPWALLVCPGYALDCCGNEILVRERVMVDIRDHLWSRATERYRLARVAIRYAEEPVGPVPAPSPACGCEDTTYIASRIRDGYQLDVLWETPDSRQAEVTDLCERPAMPCPDCVDHTHVVLAAVRRPSSEGDLITAAHIENHPPRCDVDIR